MAGKDTGIPDVDLTPVLKDIQQGQTTQEPQPDTPEKEIDLGQFKNPKDMLKSYKEIQGAFTKVSQASKDKDSRIKELEDKISELENEPQFGYPTPGVYPNQPQQPSEDNSLDILENPQQVIQQEVARAVVTTRISEILDEEYSKNPNEFQERYAYVQMLSQNPRYAHLASNAMGVKKLFATADKQREEQFRKNASKSLESIFGKPLSEEQVARLRNVVGMESPDGSINTNQPSTDAYMPDTTSFASGPGTDTGRNFEKEIEEAKERGDYEAVSKLIIEQQLAQ